MKLQQPTEKPENWLINYLRIYNEANLAIFSRFLPTVHKEMNVWDGQVMHKPT